MRSNRWHIQKFECMIYPFPKGYIFNNFSSIRLLACYSKMRRPIEIDVTQSDHIFMTGNFSSVFCQNRRTWTWIRVPNFRREIRTILKKFLTFSNNLLTIRSLSPVKAWSSLTISCFKYWSSMCLNWMWSTDYEKFNWKILGFFFRIFFEYFLPLHNPYWSRGFFQQLVCLGLHAQ